jgi:hypothetical protein
MLFKFVLQDHFTRNCNSIPPKKKVEAAMGDKSPKDKEKKKKKKVGKTTTV